MLTMFSQEGHFCHATIQAFQKKKKKTQHHNISETTNVTEMEFCSLGLQ